jgi:hypothetical protein
MSLCFKNARSLPKRDTKAFYKKFIFCPDGKVCIALRKT